MLHQNISKRAASGTNLNYQRLPDVTQRVHDFFRGIAVSEEVLPELGFLDAAQNDLFSLTNYQWASPLITRRRPEDFAFSLQFTNYSLTKFFVTALHSPKREPNSCTGLA